MKQFATVIKSCLIAALILILTPSFVNPEIPDNFDVLWERVEAFSKKGLPRSAIEQLEVIHNKALSENNQPQLLKATLYRFSLLQTFEEDHLIKAIGFAQQTLPLLGSPGKEIMHSIIAELYWFFYQENRYILLERKTSASIDSQDLKEWDVTRLQDSIESHYGLSLRSQSITDTIPTKSFEPILIQVPKDAFQQQPSLFGFLASRVLHYYTSRDAALQQTLPDVALKDSKLWQSSALFAAMQLPQSSAGHDDILKLLQQLLASNLRQKHTEALINNELFRFQYLKDHFFDGNAADSLHLQALQSLQERHGNHPASTLVAAERASLLTSGALRNLEDTLAFANALQICNQAIKAFPQSRGASLCRLTKENILKAEIGLTVQRVELPGKPIPVRLEYRNLTQPAFRLVRISSDALSKIMELTNQQQRAEALSALVPDHKWSISLPFEPDYGTHSTIFDLPALENGLYVLLAAADSTFSDENVSAFTSFQVSKLGFVQHKRDNNLFYLLDRDSGKPVYNADILVLTRDYDYQNRNYTITQRLKLKSKRDGSFEIGPNTDLPPNQAFYVEVMTKKDTLYSDNFFDSYHRKASNRVQTKTWFFADRSIYRPGQTIFFKGIILQKNGSQADWEIKPKHSTTVRFLDVNRKEVQQIRLTTNEYGSFEGSFSIPENLLTGSMIISNEDGSQELSVEAYKRPLFEVILEPGNTQKSVGDTIIINGKARAFAGFGLDSVEVRYRVEREKSYPYWPWWKGFPPYHIESIQISSGTTYTNREGDFQISFKALADANDAEENIVYRYVIAADVIDRNGETRSGKLVVPLGKLSLIMQSNLKEVISKDQLNGFHINLTDLQGKSASALIKVTYYRFDEDKRVLRPALLDETDRMCLQPEALERLFPWDNFTAAEEPENRPKETIHSSSVFVAGSTPAFPSTAQEWPEGNYLAEFVSKDDKGREQKLYIPFSLFDKWSKKMPFNQTAWFYLDKDTVFPKDTLTLFVASAATGSRVLVEISSGNELRYRKWHRVGKRKLAIPYMVREEDRGQLLVQALLVKHNRVHHLSELVQVPFTNKMLDIRLETERMKLLPGAEESWNISILGAEKERVKAELLAAMYDASLDQFKQHAWYFNAINHRISGSRWTFDNGFLLYRANRLYPQKPIDISIPPQYDIALNWFGLHTSAYWRNSRYSQAVMAKSAPANGHNGEVEIFGVINDVQDADDIGQLDGQPQHEAPTGFVAAQRSDFRETAFFYPQLLTDSIGNVNLKFKLPDALTRWKLMLLAHTKDLKSGYQTYTFEASKDLMIVPNHTRFYRIGDTAWLAAKIVNTSQKTLNGIAEIEISDAVTNHSLNLLQENKRKPFVNLLPGQSRELKWKAIMSGQPALLALKYSVSSGTYTDSELQWLPLLPSNIVVTSSMPLMIPGHSNKSFVFESLQNASEKEKNLRYNFQISSHPVWYAIQALPYLNSQKNASTEQLFHRVFVNTLSSYIAQNIPSAMQVIESWKEMGAESLLSNLERNQQLKQTLLEETPWVLAASDENEQKRALTLLFDINRMQYERSSAIRKLNESQLPDGSWPWFPGMRGNRYMTQTIVLGMGRLMEIMPELQSDASLNEMLSKAMNYLSDQMLREHKKMENEKQLGSFRIGTSQLDYLLIRTHVSIPSETADFEKMVDFYLNNLSENWSGLDLNNQAKAVIVFYRNGLKDTAHEVVKSLKERSLYNEFLGVYWKHQAYGTAASIESQSLMIAAFNQAGTDTLMIDGIRQWLIANKQTNQWPTSRATSEAIFALLNHGTDWIGEQQKVQVSIGGEKLEMSSTEAGTAYYEQSWYSENIKPELGNIVVDNPNAAPAWGAVFREYAVAMDEVGENQTSLRITRELYCENGSNASKWVPLTDQAIRTGDKVKVRIVVESDRDMEFIHLRDRRAAGFEPESTLSAYQWKAGVGFYEAVDDLHTDFFFDFLPKGKHVLEYNLIAMHEGRFVHGHASIQSYYAPEFSANSKGIRVHILAND